MNYIDFTEVFIHEFEKQNKNLKIRKYINREKSMVIDCPYKDIHIEIKPLNSGIFVIWMVDFRFFNYELLKKYLEKKLKHHAANFRLNSDRVYIYPKDKINVKQNIAIIEFTAQVLLKMIEKIETALAVE